MTCDFTGQFIKRTFYSVSCRFFFFVVLSCLFLEGQVSAQELDTIHYVSQQYNSISGVLIPDPSPGTVPETNNDLIGFTLDGRVGSISLSKAENGWASVSASIAGIEEGPHSARLTSDNPDRSLKDSKQILFIYDITPPDLELVYPSGVELSKNVLSFLVAFSDDGSGIPSQRADMDVSVTINGTAAFIETVEDANKRYFLIDHNGRTGIQGGSRYSLHISLKDRAGNEAILEQQFNTEDAFVETEIEKQECVTPGNETFTFDAPVRKDFSFPITNRLSPILFSEMISTDILEIAVDTGEEIDQNILADISVTTDHPEIELRRLPGTDEWVRYEVKQKRMVSSLDALTYLTVEHPALLLAQYQWECSADGLQMEPSQQSLTTSPEKTSFQIPVLLYWKNSRAFEIKSSVESDGSYFLEYLTWTEPSSQLLDIGASYLTFRNSSYFFDQQDGMFRSKAPVEKEGFYGFQVTLASKTGVWAHNGTSIGHEDHEMFFDLGGPVIYSFIYNTEEKQLEAVFSDLGTPINDLQISVKVDGYGKRDFTIEAIEGGKSRLVSPLSMPISVVDAHLSIIDLAQNNGTKSCKIFGLPPEEPEDGNTAVTEFALKEKDEQDPEPAEYQVLAHYEGGVSLVRECPVEQVIGVSDYHILDKVELTSRKETRYYPYRPYLAGGGSTILLHTDLLDVPPPMVQMIHPVTGELLVVKTNALAGKDRSYRMFTFEYCRNFVKDVLPPEIKAIAFNPTSNILSATVSDHGRPVSEVNTWLRVGVEDSHYFNKSDTLEHLFTPDQQPVVPPILSAPGIPHYSVKQKILSSLESYRVDQRFSRVDSNDQGGATPADKSGFTPVIDGFISYMQNKSSSQPESLEPGYGLTGRLEATLPIPPLVLGEKYNVSISAWDSAGNKSSETLLLTIPRSPPVVTLELINTDSTSSFTAYGAEQSNTHLRASAIDESGLDLPQTYLDLDSIRISPISSYGTGGLGDPPRNPYGASFNAMLSDSYRGTLLDDYVAHYSVLLDEGAHAARFLATDIIGLTAEAQLDFSVDYIPRITSFVSKPKAIQDIGGPAFTAMILDRGNDLELAGITFLIDGREVDRDTLYYDPPSGYFAVSGPLDHESGFHSARIIAQDNNNHQAAETIRFVMGDEITTVAGGTDLRLDSINIWELKYKNNDGQANPGEFIRLFPTLFNDGPVPLEECRAALFAEDNRINVETNEIATPLIGPATTTTLLKGFDVRIGPDILDATISDPYDTHFRLDITCRDGSWELPFTLPIYRPTLPIDINSEVTIELEPTARVSNEPQTTIRGTVISRASYIEDMSISVNSNFVEVTYLDRATGAFEATIPLEPGSNIIEIEAHDRSGATGYKTTFINCRSMLTVSIDSLPGSTAESRLTISGSVESSASLVERLVLTVNGRQQPIVHEPRQHRFEATIHLEQGSNVIVVEAWDEGGSYGRDSARVGLNSSFSVSLDALPPSTPNETMTITGTVQSNSRVDRVELLVNGAPLAVSYNRSSGRFSASASLAVGGNSIVAQATNATGSQASDRAYVTRTTSFTPPSITITSPPGGRIDCAPFTISGTFDPGSSTVDRITVTANPAYIDPPNQECRNMIIGPNNFSVMCDENVNEDEVIYTIEIRTTDGSSATDSVILRTESCG